MPDPDQNQGLVSSHGAHSGWVLSEMTPDDFEEAMALWRMTEGIGLSASDSAERIGAYLERNPGLSFVARNEGDLVGAILSGHDGRRGFIHHLAVATDFQRQGCGRALVDGCLAALAQECVPHPARVWWLDGAMHPSGRSMRPAS